MESRRLDLAHAGDVTAARSRIEDYALGGEIQRSVVDMLEKQRSLEYWSPEYQAWEEVLTKYLKTGGVPELTTQYLGELFDKVDQITIPDNPLSPVYEDIHSLFTSVQGELFKGTAHSDIVQFCETVGNFYISQKRFIWRDIHSEGVANEVMLSLLSRGTYRSLMCALILYRNHQCKGFTFPQTIHDEIADRINAWRDTYVKEFKRVQEMLGARSKQYIWYRDSVLRCVSEAFTDCVSREKRVFVPAEVTLKEEQVVCRKINGYLNSGPLGLRPQADKTYAFDAMYQIFFNNKVENEDNAENCHHALCICRSAFDTMVNYLFDFYWCVKYGDLGRKLYDRIVAMDANDSQDINPDDYYASLIYRGFQVKLE